MTTNQPKNKMKRLIEKLPVPFAAANFVVLLIDLVYPYIW
jgi:hypothetical protein